MRARIARVFLAALLFLASAHGKAGAEILRSPLYKFTSVQRADLKCTSAQYAVSIPVPDRWIVKKARLSFPYVNSTALLADNSRLLVKFNGNPIAQKGLNPLAPEGTMSLALAADLFRPGYNDLLFEVQQHYSLGCEFPCQPELWTTLKLDDEDAVIEIEYELKEVPLKLASIANFLFDPKITPRGEVNIVLPDRGPETIGIASIVASGIAKKFNYQGVVFSVAGDLLAGYDNVVLGDAKFADRFMRRAGDSAEGINGPLLKILPLPRSAAGAQAQAGVDPAHAMIIVSGLNPDHLKLAAETFAVMSAPFPETDEMTVSGLVMPDIPLYGGKEVIKAGSKYTFKALDFPSHTFSGINPDAAVIRFRLPADFLVKQNLYAKLSLSYSYGAADRPDSVLNLSLNGHLIRGINLDDPRGGMIEGYKMDIPTYLFKPGDNELKFESVLAPLVTKNCEYIQTKNLFLTIMDVSTLEFPPMPHYVDMPRLELFMLNGFPITRWPDGHGSKVYLTNTEPETIEAALNLVGTITQKNGLPLLDLQYVTAPPKKADGDMIVIGDLATLPDKFKEAGPLALTKKMAFPYPVVQNWANEAQFAFSRQVSGLSPGSGAVMEFESPYAAGKSVVLLAANTAREVLALSLSVMKSGVQANMKGDLVLVDLNAPEKGIIAVSIGRRYFAGKAGPLSRLDAYLFRYPWLYDALLGAVVAALGLLLFYFLNRYRIRRTKRD